MHYWTYATRSKHVVGLTIALDLAGAKTQASILWPRFIITSLHRPAGNTGIGSKKERKGTSYPPPPNFHLIGITPVLKYSMSTVLCHSGEFFDASRWIGNDWESHASSLAGFLDLCSLSTSRYVRSIVMTAVIQAVLYHQKALSAVKHSFFLYP